ncbi:MAG TPA: IPT/TIG domain-containing protein, partial [Solirubrobacteraceae bacterium]|nr:IPT/TIG domain-containing protein [Solirubrobacteraceae bacterium]
MSSFSIALLLSSSAVALGAPSAAEEAGFTSGANAAFGATPLVELASPEVYSVEPSVGPTSGGTAVKIKGAGFLKGSTVTIGAAATGVEIKSETEILAKTAPGSAGEDEVIVTHEGHASTDGPGFTYEVLPHVTSVAPIEGTTSGGTHVVIAGTGFLAGSSVTIGSKVTSSTVVSEEEITATTAAGTAGAHEVLVVDKRGASSGGPSFTYVAPPTVTSISPTEGSSEGDTAVTIKGTNFSKEKTMTVEIGGAEA